MKALIVISLLGFLGIPSGEVFAESTPISSGDTAWMLISTALVMLMTFPGLAIFYGGLSRRKDALNTIIMSLVSYTIISILWITYGYGFSFGTDLAGIIGKPLSPFLRSLTKSSINEAAKTIPEFVFSNFQLTFAAITVALISGAWIERIKFSAWVLFTILWFTLDYIPVAHWVWGGGFLSKLSALDFAGGTVVHINAGIAALVGALILGKRREVSLSPHNLPLVVLGTGLLWFGWFGFNGGSALASNDLAAQAFINTNTAAAMAGLSWLFVEWAITKKPTVLGLASGVVAGLVAITPAAGFVSIASSIIIGLLAGIVAYLAVAKMKNIFGYDDSLDVFGIHGIAGILGCLLTGIFADPSINGAAGLLFGNPNQLWIQFLSIVVVGIYSAIVTSVILLVIKATVGLRPKKEDELVGLDESIHGERSYNFHI
ncbi:MAG: ammonium transporter [Thermodesulforhabdaceae bacterium]